MFNSRINGKVSRQLRSQFGRQVIYIIWIILCWVDLFAEASTVEMELKQKVTIPHRSKFNKTIVGGLSGLFLKENMLYAVSDDRGRFGPARIYEFSIAKRNQNFDLKISGVKTLTTTKKIKDYNLLDLEALIYWENKWVVSSEGDLHHKPRIQPNILAFDGKLKSDYIKIPDEFLANSQGILNKGLKNNMAFEGMTIDSDKKLYLSSESNLIPDKLSAENINAYLLTYSLESLNLLETRKLYFETGIKIFVYFGVSEITYWKERKFFILTRGVTLSSDLSYDCQLWLLDLEQNDKGILSPQLIYDFKENKLTQNYEGMVVMRSDGIEYLIVVSDDNFNKLENTEFLFMELKDPVVRASKPSE